MTVLLTRKEVSQYNRDFLRSSKAASEGLVTYKFTYEYGDPETPVHRDSLIVDRSYLMSDREIAGIWNDLSDQFSFYFKAGNVEIVSYPCCDIPYWQQVETGIAEF